jgi:small subunit ribosomal protein S19
MELKKKEFTYKGKTIEELKKLSIREFAQILSSRQRRSLLKHFQQTENFISRMQIKIAKNKSIKTHNRTLIIVPQMIGWNIQVYNGQKFMGFEVTGEMLGHRFGEFSMTRTKTKHGKAGVGSTKGTKHKSKK